MIETQVKQRPILFSGAMVRAILEGRKTVTRRVVNGSIKSRYGEPGDILWVRETFQRHPYDAGYIYRATDPGWDSECVGISWKPSIFMPREACRLRLRVTDVRVERLQEISEEQANAEGCDLEPTDQSWPQCRRWFKDLWNEINEKRGYGWDVNPDVWVVEFEKIEAAQ